MGGEGWRVSLTKGNGGVGVGKINRRRTRFAQVRTPREALTSNLLLLKKIPELDPGSAASRLFY